MLQDTGGSLPPLVVRPACAANARTVAGLHAPPLELVVGDLTPVLGKWRDPTSHDRATERQPAIFVSRPGEQGPMQRRAWLQDDFPDCPPQADAIDELARQRLRRVARRRQFAWDRVARRTQRITLAIGWPHGELGVGTVSDSKTFDGKNCATRRKEQPGRVRYVRKTARGNPRRVGRVYLPDP